MYSFLFSAKRMAKNFRENLVKASALDEVLSSLASATPEQERERVFEGISLCPHRITPYIVSFVDQHHIVLEKIQFILK